MEILVYQKPFYRWWAPPREYPWLYDQRQSHGGWGGPGQIVKREIVRTDLRGRAVVRFETPVSARQDFEYTIEARVTDASRREVAGAGTVRVTRQRYHVYPRARRNLYRPAEPQESMPGILICHSHHRPKEHQELQDMGMTNVSHIGGGFSGCCRTYSCSAMPVGLQSWSQWRTRR